MYTLNIMFYSILSILNCNRTSQNKNKNPIIFDEIIYFLNGLQQVRYVGPGTTRSEIILWQKNNQTRYYIDTLPFKCRCQSRKQRLMFYIPPTWTPCILYCSRLQTELYEDLCPAMFTVNMTSSDCLGLSYHVWNKCSVWSQRASVRHRCATVAPGEVRSGKQKTEQRCPQARSSFFFFSVFGWVSLLQF